MNPLTLESSPESWSLPDSGAFLTKPTYLSQLILLFMAALQKLGVPTCRQDDAATSADMKEIKLLFFCHKNFFLASMVTEVRMRATDLSQVIVLGEDAQPKVLWCEPG